MNLDQPVSSDATEPLALPEVRLNGVRVHALTESECVAYIVAELAAGRGGYVVTTNLDHLKRTREDPKFRELVRNANVVVADGMPLIWASRLQGTPLPERVPGSNLIWSLTEAAVDGGCSVFFLGGDRGTAEGAAEVLQSRHPNLRVAGSHCPPVGFENDKEAVSQLEKIVISARPDIVYVALGSPKQEHLIDLLRRQLPETWWLGVGISLSFVCGRIHRAPKWVQQLGLEWGHRLAQEPRRLWRRYLLYGLPFASSFLAGAALKRFFPGRLNRDGTS